MQHNSFCGQATQVSSRYLPLVAGSSFISFASSDSFSRRQTRLALLDHSSLWLFPNTSPETLATIHFITRKIAHFTEYAILGLLGGARFRTSPRPAIASTGF